MLLVSISNDFHEFHSCTKSGNGETREEKEIKSRKTKIHSRMQKKQTAYDLPIFYSVNFNVLNTRVPARKQHNGLAFKKTTSEKREEKIY